MISSSLFSSLFSWTPPTFLTRGSANVLHKCFDEANVTSVLIPLVSEHIGDPTEITITGGRGDYPAAFASAEDGQSRSCGDDPWSMALEGWLSSGAAIKYILVDPSEDVRGQFAELSRRYEKFDPREIDIEGIEDPLDAAACREFVSYHPSVFAKPETNELALWIEGFHPPGTKTAKNCQFIYQGRWADGTRSVKDTLELLGVVEKYSQIMNA